MIRILEEATRPEEIAAAGAGDLVWVPPADLIDGPNHRTSLHLTPGFLASVARDGISTPCIGTITSGGQARLRIGFRRRAAAAKAAYAVPVFIVAREIDATDEELADVLRRWDENEHRAGLTEADRAVAIQATLDLPGMTEATTAKALGVERAIVRAAGKVVQSDRAQAATVNHGLTLIQAAGLAEVEEYPDAVQALEETLANEPEQFDHVLAEQRQRMAYLRAAAKLAAKLTAEGIHVAEEHPGHQNWLHGLMDAEGHGLDAEDSTHQLPEDQGGCPGRAAWVHESYRRSGDAEAMPYCTDPARYGHKSRYGGSMARQAGPLSDGELAERKAVIDGNRAWRAAREVRQAWLTDWLARGSVPPAVLAYALRLSVTHGFHGLHRQLEGTSRQGITKKLLGIKGEEPDYDGRQRGEVGLVEAAFAKATDKRVQVLWVAFIIGACETQADDQAWRSPRGYRLTAAYLTWLSSLGYVLSECEQAMITGSAKEDDK